MPRLRAAITILLLTIAALLLASPYALYRLGLSGVEGLPQKPLHLASREQQALVWQQARGEGVPHITSMSPYSLAAKILSKTNGRTHPGELVAWWVASEYLNEHRRYQGNSWWHLSGAALTIWLSQNWTSEEILSAAFYSRQQRMNDDDIKKDRSAEAG